MNEAAKEVRPKQAFRSIESAASGKGTRERILDTAEQLFALEGPAAVTLRSIAAAAQVNVAAVNYHFGSKDKLFEEMFLRRIAPLNEKRLAGLAERSEAAGGAPSLEAIITAYVMPALLLTDEASASARAIVVQYSLGRVLAMPEVDTMLVRYYDRVRTEFVAALQRAAPHLAAHEVVWRYYWMGGSVMVSLAVAPGMVGSAEDAGKARTRGASNGIAGELIAFLVQGFGP
jgi:AcrR family transcriptional regulator